MNCLVEFKKCINTMNENNIELVRNFINNCDINMKDDMGGNTLLMEACDKGNTEVITLLLNNDNCDVNIQNDDDMTALYMAYHNLNSVRLLLNTGKCDVNIMTCDGTILHIACRGGAVPVVQLLLDAGNCDINIIDDSCTGNGNTALTHACSINNEDIVRLLLNTGNCDVHIKNNDNLDAYHITGSKTIRKLLTDYIKRTENIIRPDERYMISNQQLLEQPDCLICAGSLIEDEETHIKYNRTDILKCPACRGAVFHKECMNMFRNEIYEHNINLNSGNLREFTCPKCRNADVWKNLLLE